MAPRGPRKKKDAIEDLKDSLYSRAKEPQIHPEQRTPLSPMEDIHPPVAWSDTKIEDVAPRPLNRPFDAGQPAPMAKKRMSFATKFFIASFAFFVCAVGVAAYLFYYGGDSISPQNIDLQVVSSSVIDGGKESTFQIIIDNRNQSPLQLADLSIDYPDGTRDPTDQTKALSHDQQSIGDIAAGQELKRTTSAVFYGQEGSQQKLIVTLQYSVPGSNSVFQKQAEADFTLGSSPVSISLNAPQEAIAGQQFTIDATVTSNSTSPIADLVLEGQYPFGFSVASTSPSADTGGTIWRLGTLQPGASQTMHLTGTIDGQDGDQRVFRFTTGSIADPTDTQIQVPFITVPQTITVRKPFVTATIALNGQSGTAVSIPGQQTIQGTVTWQNNLTVPVSNLQLNVSFSGPMLDQSSINSANGFYQSQDSTIVWSKDQDETLAQIAPGASGTEQFTFSTLAPGQGGTVYTNPVVNLNVSVSGERQDQTNVPETVSSAASTAASIASALSIGAQAFYFSGPFQNSGPMPPEAEQPTTYTIVWTVKNPSNAVANATVQATLPTYVTFVQAQAGSGIQYDAGSHTVSWDIGDLDAGVGYSTAALTGAFQVALTPSVSQVGSSPPLMSATSISGQDRFAQVGVSATAAAPTTLLSGDAQFTSAMANVAPKQ